MGISVLYKPNVIIGNVSSASSPEQEQTFYNLLTNNIQSYTLPLDIGIKRELRSCAFASTTLRRIYLKNACIIPSYCFTQARNLEGVVGSMVTRIDEGAFNGCVKLKNADIFSNCFTIGNSAFINCFSLTSVVLDFPYTTIGFSAFRSCNHLKTAFIYSTFTTADAFAACTALEKVDLHYTNYIQNTDFVYCSNLREVSAFCIVQLGARNFEYCYNLREIKGFENVAQTNGGVFNGCSALSSAFFPFLISMTGNGTFESCINLAKVELGGILSVGSSTFKNCNSLRSLIFLTASCPSLTSDSNVFQNTPIADSSYLGRFGSIYVPSYLVSTMKAAQNWSNYADRIAALSSGYDSKFVYAYEFYNQYGLKRIPNSKSNAEYICTSAFTNCSSISSALLSKCERIGSRAFYNCTSLRRLSIPNCEHILCEGFKNCQSLQTLNAPNLKYVGSSAFTFCTHLTSVSIPNCKVIRANAFSACYSLNSLYAPACEVVEGNAFRSCNNLSIIDLPNCVYYGGACDAVTSLNLPKVKVVNGLGAFKSSTIYFPNCISFAGCYDTSYIQEIYLPKAVNVANCGACVNLKKVEIPNCVSLQTGTFGGCSSLSEIFLQKVSAVGYVTFRSCINLQRILFANLSYIGTGGGECFSQCLALNSLYLFSLRKVTLEYTNDFNYTPMTDSSYLGHYGSIYVPAHLVSEYQADSKWSYLSDRFVGLTDQEMQDIIDHWND